MKEYKYKVYNPHLQPLEHILTTEPIENDWLLLKVLYVNEYEMVAVFEKDN